MMETPRSANKEIEQDDAVILPYLENLNENEDLWVSQGNIVTFRNTLSNMLDENLAWYCRVVPHSQFNFVLDIDNFN